MNRTVAMGTRLGAGLGKLFHWGSLLLLTLFSTIPFFWVISTALKPPLEIYALPPYWIPKDPTLQNFKAVLAESQVIQSLYNSFLVGTWTTLACLGIALLAGYGLARFQFRGKGIVATSILLGQMVPQAVLLVPMFILLNKMQLIDTMGGLTLSYLTLTVPLSIWMMRGYFLGIPREIEEAAMVDGCNRFQALIKVILPIARPGIVATALYIFIVTWQEFLYALTFTNSAKTRTLAIQLNYFSDEITVDWGLTMAASVLMAIPIMLVFLLLHKHFVQGLSAGSVKG